MKKKTVQPLKLRITFIGGGNMAEAMIRGLTAGTMVAPGDIYACDIKEDRLAYLKKKYKIRTCRTNGAALHGADIIFLAIKPQHMRELLMEIGPLVQPGQIVISIAAGITTAEIESMIPRKTPVIRCMPNTPALLGSGAAGVARGSHASAGHLKIAIRLFETVGTVVAVPEKDINAVTALSGSGPAYVFYLAEAMQAAGEQMGLSSVQARTLANQTVLGAGRMLCETGTTARELRHKVTSPGGTTEAALNVMQQHKLDDIMIKSILRAQKRAGELSNQ